MSLENKISQISTLDFKDQGLQLNRLIDELAASGSSSGLQLLAQKVISNDKFFQAAKTAMVNISVAVKSLPEDELYETACYLVNLFKQQASPQTFDEADFNLRDSLFTYCINCEQYTEGAQFLAGANLDNSTFGRAFTDLEKVDVYIKCAGRAGFMSIISVQLLQSLLCMSYFVHVYNRGGFGSR
jgi:uncharacterized protein YjbI with pentapeptide repeats